MTDDFPLPSDHMHIDLTTIQGCLEELETISNALLYTDHLWGMVVDGLSEAETTYAAAEAEAAKDARLDAPASATATEIKGRITQLIAAKPSSRKAYDELRKWENRKAKLERWIRSLEKRQGGAQAARNGHEVLSRAGGH